MGFTRPVDTLYPIGTQFGDKSKRYTWSIDPDNNLWIPCKDKEGNGHHNGIDFSCPSGTTIRAICDGMIIRSRFEDSMDHRKGAGLYITQLANTFGYDNWSIKYSHLKASYVGVGEYVKEGQPIAESGKSGNVLYSYLHVDLLDLYYQWKKIPFEGVEKWS